jgi:hypothetical protein
VRLTTRSRALLRAEVTTTAVAVATSTALYLRSGHAYLARGVVGDIAGLALLTGVLAALRRRLRHEALVCLGAIGIALAVDPEWPLRRSSGFWWVAVTAGLAGYLTARWVLLSRVRL